MRIDAFAMNVTSRLKNKKSVNLKKQFFNGKIVNFYTEILSRKVVLWHFFMSETREKHPQFNFFESKS
jgi:hypothetical protein